MDTIDITSSKQFHQDFDHNVRELLEPVRDVLLESFGSCTSEEIVGQLLMNLFDYDTCEGKLSSELKIRLVGIADHMGPDWAQALYRAAVFITKVA